SPNSIGQKIGVRPRFFLHGYFCCSTQPASVAASASASPGLGGIGTWPQAPLLPARIRAASRAAAAASPEYFAAISRKDGPTTRWSRAWQPLQAFAASSLSIGSVPPASVSGAAAGAGRSL